MTMPGVPFVYYGDELGMQYIDSLPSKEGGFNRTGSRTPMQWNKGKNAGFSDAAKEELYLPVTDDGINAEEQMEDESSLLHTMKRLIALRKSSQALSADGEIEFLNRKYGGYPLVYQRTGKDGTYVICINPTDRPQEFACDLNSAKVVMENDKIAIEETKFTLSPISYAIIGK